MTLTKSTSVGAVPFEPCVNGANFFGDYTGLTALGDGSSSFAATWADSRRGCISGEYGEDLYTAQYTPLTDGSDVHLAPPPQGGQVLFIGAWVEGLSGDEIELTGRVRDLETDSIIQEDTRTATMQPMPDRPGFSETDPSSLGSVSNIALCPNYGAQILDATRRESVQLGSRLPPRARVPVLAASVVRDLRGRASRLRVGSRNLNFE